VTQAVPPSKKATELVQANALRIDISQADDVCLRERVRHERGQLWRQDHADFIAAYNETVAREGLPLDKWRSF
jgi:antitoxin CcdA